MSERRAPIIDELEPLFNPQSVAVIGATNHWNKWGFSTFVSLLDGFKGKVYPINHKEETVLGYPAFKRVTDIPQEEPVDLAVFVIPAGGVPAVMEDCVDKGVRAGVIISAGFAETGEKGKRLQDEVVRIARRGPLRFIGPNCMGFWSASSHLKAFMFPLPVSAGPLAFVSQGGNVGGTVVATGSVRGIGFHRYISCGCTADIQIEDYIEHFGRDPQVKVILAYIEGLNDGQRFIEKVGRVTAEKPVITMKPGKTSAGSKAISSHSGAMAGSSELYDSAFKKAGVLRVDTAEELLDVAIGFLTQPLPRGRNVGIITPGGSYGVISADACASLGLNVVKLSQETIAEFDHIFPPRWSHGNPVDPAGDRNFIAYMKAPELLLKLPEVDAMIFMGYDSFSRFASVFASISEDISQALKGAMRALRERAPMDIPEETSEGEMSWIGQVITKVVELFFSMFGTSDSHAVGAFSDRLVSLMKSPRVSSALTRKIHTALRLLEEEGHPDGLDPFVRLFGPLLEALLLDWSETYQKPIMTTTFMDTATPMTDMGYYAYPSPEQASFVLAKLLEYRETLDRAKGINTYPH